MRKPSVISLYTGAGGLDYGLEAAGMETCVGIDFDPDSCATIRRNREWPILEESIFDVEPGDLLAEAKRRTDDVDVVAGGPPCQPFSKSGYWVTGDTRRMEDDRAKTLAAFMDVVEAVRPRVVLLENVGGLKYANKNEAIRYLLRRFSSINRKSSTSYAPVFDVLSAADYGVPQLRDRFFLVAERSGLRLAFPPPTHGHSGDHPESSLRPRSTAWDALGDLEDEDSPTLGVTGKWADLLPSIPEGQNYLWHTSRGGGEALFGWRRRYWSFLLKLAKDLPSWTIQAQPGPATGPFHWKSRRLSMRELCRIQTFPDDVEVVGDLRAIQRQVGNAVPSLLAEILGRCIATQLLDLGEITEPLALLPPNRGAPPEAERVRGIPKKYLKLVDDHEPHPGTGKGYGASRRAEASRSAD